MTYVSPDPDTTDDSVYFDIDGVEEAIHKAAAKWLAEVRLNLYLMDGHIVAELEGEHSYRTPYAEFFQLDNEEPPDCEEFLLAGLQYFRGVYGREPGQPRTSKDEEDYV
jgi:hypothetical protein